MRIFVTHICPKNKILEYGVSISASNFNYNLIDGGVFDKVYSVYPGFVRRRLNESYKRRGLGGFWLRRVRKVIVPYFFVIVVYRLCKGYLEPLPFLLDVVGLDTTYWFIEYIVYWYIAFYVTSRWLPRWRVMAMVVVGFVMLFTLKELCESSKSFFFVAGVAASQHSDELRRISRKWWLWILVAAMVVGIAFLGIKQLPVLRAHSGELVYSLVQMFQNLGFTLAVIAFLPFFGGRIAAASCCL